MAFATLQDVEKRQARALSEEEEQATLLLLDMATAYIAQAADKDEDWVEDLDDVPPIIRAMTVELVSRALANPSGLFSIQEQIGSYQYTKSFNRDVPSGMGLTETEVLMVRRVILGTNSGSGKAASVADELAGD